MDCTDICFFSEPSHFHRAAPPGASSSESFHLSLAVYPRMCRRRRGITEKRVGVCLYVCAHARTCKCGCVCVIFSAHRLALARNTKLSSLNVKKDICVMSLLTFILAFILFYMKLFRKSLICVTV